MTTKMTLNLINDYLKDIQVCMELFSERYGRKDIIKAWHEGGISQAGKLTDAIEYELHGIGCCVVFPGREVDFDFGPELRTDGFDLWRLKKYLEQRPDLQTCLSDKELEADFNKLIKDGVIKKKYEHSSLYFY